MNNDWLDLIDWRQIGLGTIVGVLLPLFLTILLAVFGLSSIWALLLAVTLLSVLLGGVVAAWRSYDRQAQLVNGGMVAVACMLLSLLASVSSSAGNGGVASLLFLVVSYGVAGLLGGFASPFVHERVAALRNN